MFYVLEWRKTLRLSLIYPGPVKITQAFWSPARTPEALIDEFNKLPGMMGKFSVAAAGA